MTSSFPQPYSATEAQYHLLEWVAPDVLHVSFNRPPVNALVDELWRETHRIFDHVRRDGDVRAVVLSGQNRCFTAGLDVFASVFPGADGDAARKAFVLREYVRDFQAAISSLEDCEKPVVAATHSHCIGGAIDLLSACDVRFAAADSIFSIKEVDIGLAADIGTLQRFPKIVRSESVARELALTARNFSAQEALDIGFVSKVVPGSYSEVLAEAVKTASLIASKSPVATRSTKVLMVHARDHSVEEGLRFTRAWNAAMLQSDDIPAAMMATMQKKQAVFPKL